MLIKNCDENLNDKQKAVLFILYNYILWHKISKKQKSLNIILAFLFMLTETFWTSITKETDYGIRFVLNKGHTTWIQFYLNVIFLNILTNIKKYKTKNKRILLTPIHIWLLEIIEGNLLIFLFNKNIAWTYNTKDAFFNKSIRVNYYPVWLLVGVALEYLYKPLIRPLERKIYPYSNILLFSTYPLSFLTDKYIGWPQLKI
jgi:hypothetical protein